MPLFIPPAIFLSGTAITAQPPDGTIVGGNARGSNAVDLQAIRTSAANVASGTNSGVLSGKDNGATGIGSVVPGGEFNFINAASWGTISGGFGNSHNAQWGTISGGRENSGGNGAAFWCPGGQQGSGRGLPGRGFWAAGFFANGGDAQAGEFILRRSTTDATATRLTADNAAPGATNTINLPNNSRYNGIMLVDAHQTGGSAGAAGDGRSWTFAVSVKRGASAATTTLNYATSLATGGDAATAAWTCVVAADTTNGGISITFTGEANKSVRVAARFADVEVTS